MNTAPTLESADERQLFLFEIDVDGCETYWVAASGVYEALEIFRGVEPSDSELYGLSIERQEEAHVARKSFRDDDGTKRSLWSEFLTHKEPGIVASTLY